MSKDKIWWLSWFIFFVAVAGAVFNLYKLQVCFLFWLLSNILTVYISYRRRLPGLALQFVIYSLISAYGLIKWR